jgi:hypothetical protein
VDGSFRQSAQAVKVQSFPIHPSLSWPDNRPTDSQAFIILRAGSQLTAYKSAFALDKNRASFMLVDGTHDIRWLLERDEGSELLYKFRSARNESHRDCLARGKIWIGAAMALNDPFDSKPKEFLNRATAEEANAYREAVRQLRVLCFSGPFTGGPDDLLRWSHYGDGHQGYCLMIRDAAILAKTRPVTYHETYPDLAEHTPTTPGFWETVGFFKASCWKYEDERRALFPNGSELEYTIPACAIWGVVFGCWSLRDQRFEVARLALANNPKCFFFNAEIVKKSFSLEYHNTTTKYR